MGGNKERLVCVCGCTLRPRAGESLGEAAERCGWTYYPSSPHEDTNALCTGCKELDDDDD